MTRSLIARLLAVGVGVWLMFAPAVLDYGDPAQTSDRVVGPIAAAFAFVACWEVLMPLRWATVPLGVWLVVAPAALQFESAAAWWSSIASGAIIVATAFVGGDVRQRFGGGWRTIRPSAWN